MKIHKEADLYEPVRLWFQDVLSRRFRQAEVHAYNTSRIRLSTLIGQRGLQAHFPQSNVWDIQADITALVIARQNHVAFVECKTGPVTLRDIGQLLGYSRVAKPVRAVLLSLKPPTDALRTLLTVYGRYDILEYDDNRNRILIAQWDPVRGGVLHSETLPPGENI